MKKIAVLLILTFSLFSCVKQETHEVALEKQEARLTAHVWKGVSVSRFTGKHKIFQHSLPDISLRFYPDQQFVKNIGQQKSITGQWELFEQNDVPVLRIRYFDEDTGCNVIDELVVNILTDDYLEYCHYIHRQGYVDIHDDYFFEKN